jgi:hypothetical protein
MSKIYLLFATLAASYGMLSAAQVINEVTVNMMKISTKIPFTRSTTIAQIKQMVADKEGPLPVEQLQLFKTEWVRSGFLPKQQSIILEDDKTCDHYHITAASTIRCIIKLP